MAQKFIAVLLMFIVVNVFAVEVSWPVPPAGYASASNNVPKGTLSGVINYPTRKYGNRPFRIHLPPGYSATRIEKYPVLYLFHGIGGNENAWTSNAGHAEGNADKVMDYLYAQASLQVTPMLVVMPMGNMTNTSGDTWQNFEDVLINDLIPYIQANYNASSDPNYRAIAGLSMGGGQTLNFGYKNPALFTWIGAFSPAPNTIAAGTTIRDMAAVKSNVHLNFLAAGSSETMYLNTARTYHNYLQQNGVSNLYLQIEQGLNHERENWNRQLHNFAQRIFKGMNSSLTVTTRGLGTVDRNPNRDSFEKGSRVTLSATPSQGWVFDGWGGDASGNQNPLEVTMDASKSIIANFLTTDGKPDLVMNGNFSSGIDSWTFNNWNGSGTGSVVNGEYSLTVSTVGNNHYDIQVVQPGIRLEQGRTYRLMYEAYASANRVLTVNVGMPVDPWTTFLTNIIDGNSEVSLTTSKQLFVLDFTMGEPTYEDSRVEFSAGTATPSVFIDNVSLFEIATPVVSAHSTKQISKQCNVRHNRSLLNISLGTNETGGATLYIFDVRGKVIRSAKISAHSGATGNINFSTADIPKGYYLVQVHSGNTLYKSGFLVTGK